MLSAVDARTPGEETCARRAALHETLDCLSRMQVLSSTMKVAKNDFVYLATLDTGPDTLHRGGPLTFRRISTAITLSSQPNDP
jgi:hypothetical protein